MPECYQLVHARRFPRRNKISDHRRGLPVDRDLYTIIGVLPPGFRHPERKFPLPGRWTQIVARVRSAQVVTHEA
jgi:hypothetical protein